MKPIVYLAGPIEGLTREQATDWRYAATEELVDLGIECLNPMRGKILDTPIIPKDCREYEDAGVFFTPKAIMTRDHNDVMRADALLVNVLGMRQRGIGTVMEIAWAFQLHKPVVMVMEREGNPYDNHPMLSQAIGFRCDTLEEGIDTVATILNR